MRMKSFSRRKIKINQETVRTVAKRQSFFVKNYKGVEEIL